jgi:hypothetical protein
MANSFWTGGLLICLLQAVVLGMGIGDTVRLTTNLKVRTGPSRSFALVSNGGIAPAGTMGKVIAGPRTAEGYTWWKVDFGPGLYPGWTVQDGFEVTFTAEATADTTMSLFFHEGNIEGPLASGVRLIGIDGAGTSVDQITNTDGCVVMKGRPGTWRFTASKNGYETATWSQDVTMAGVGETFVRQESQSPVGVSIADKSAIDARTSPIAADPPATYKLPGLNDPVYYEVLRNGSRIGYMVTTRIPDGQRVTTTQTYCVEVKGANAVMGSVYTTDKAVETMTGEPLAFERSAFTLSPGKSIGGEKRSGSITKQGKVSMATRTLNAGQTSEFAWPEKALLAEGKRLFRSKHGMQPGQQFSIKTLDMETLKGDEESCDVKGRTSVSLCGGVSLLTEVVVKAPGNNPAQTVYYDDCSRRQKVVWTDGDARMEMVACTEESLYRGSPAPKRDVATEPTGSGQVAEPYETEFQSDCAALEEKTSEFIKQHSGKALRSLSVIEAKGLWNKWNDLQFRWAYAVDGKIVQAGALKHIENLPDQYMPQLLPSWILRASDADSMPKIDFLSPRTFYMVFGKPQRTEVIPGNFTMDHYCFWYDCADGNMGIKVMTGDNTKAKYQFLLVDVGGVVSF